MLSIRLPWCLLTAPNPSGILPPTDRPSLARSLIGALGFWPATVLFPVEMYRKIHKPGRSAPRLLPAATLHAARHQCCLAAHRVSHPTSVQPSDSAMLPS